MYNHAPEGYFCPFCLIVDGVENDDLYKTDRENSNPEDRLEYSKRLRDYFMDKNSNY
ncbi:hypothetical protein [Clostridium paridis]|uniref:Uncharacterized protein n=1 Tax=Clostridium paridis TaxID=2803863 RepID=A0A937FF69_9CLOT|nr:hypothetical protein [Clostridium paridis]MBL4932239.1 hypothetical protein [Clostridium paridis]